jgi:hypothetical protein
MGGAAGRWAARLAAAALTAGAGAAAETGAGALRAVYDGYLGGLWLAEVRLALDARGGAYAVEATVAAQGLAAVFAPSAGAARASGRIEAGAVKPAAFEADGRFGATPQKVAMRYDGPGPATLTADPPLRVRSYDPAPETLAGALDPLAAAVAALAPGPAADACDRTVPVFDSRRRFDLRLGPPVADGAFLRCEGLFVRVSGYKRKHLALRDQPFTTWWRVADGRAEFVRAQAATPYGHATLVRR